MQVAINSLQQSVGAPNTGSGQATTVSATAGAGTGAGNLITDVTEAVQV